MSLIHTFAPSRLILERARDHRPWNGILIHYDLATALKYIFIIST
jgi:hypothetical protein